MQTTVGTYADGSVVRIIYSEKIIAYAQTCAAGVLAENGELGR